MRETNFTRLTRPASPPFDLNVGKPNAREAFFNSALTALFILFSALGAWVASLFGPGKFDSLIPSEYNFVGGWRLIGYVFGWAIGLFAAQNAWLYSKLTRLGWATYYRMLEDWNRVMLNAYDVVDGQEELVNVNIFEANPKIPTDVLGIALATHQRVKGGAARNYPYSIRGLDGSHYFVGPRGNQILAGILAGTRPEEFNRLFCELGFIRGQKPGSAGEWVPQDEVEVMAILFTNWPKLNRAYVSDTVKLTDVGVE